MRRADETIETLERAENRIDVAVVGDVITEVMHRRGVIGEIQIASTPSQTSSPIVPYTVEIAYAVAVGVLKGAGINLDRSSRPATKNTT